MIRRLDPEADRAAFEQAWQWIASYPAWLREIDAQNRPDFDTFLELSRRQIMLSFGLFDDDRLMALIQFTQRAPNIFETHMDSNRDAKPDAIADAIFCLGWQLLEQGAQIVFAWVPKQHRGSLRVCRSCRLEWDGTTEERGTLRGKPIKWLRMVITQEQWQQIRNEQHN